jgi:hypothetical protein
MTGSTGATRAEHVIAVDGGPHGPDALDRYGLPRP